jgi:flagellum-specific peptidoglycan hydrolase FlgJ
MDLIGKLQRKISDYFQPKQQPILSPLADKYGGDFIPNQAMAYSMANDQSRVDEAQRNRSSKVSDYFNSQPTTPSLTITPTPTTAPIPRKQVLSARDNYAPTPTPTFKPIFNYHVVTPEKINEQLQKQFQGKEPITWDNFIKLAEQEGTKRGYDWKTLVKQKALESAFGTSQFAKERNNFGGIGAYDSNPNSAFSFKSPAEYFDYYDKMIQKRFPNAYKVRDNPKKYIEELKKGGYATDPNYVDKVLNTPLRRGS